MQRTLIVPIIFLLMPGIALAQPDVVRLSEPVQTTASHEVYGQLLDDALPHVSLSSLLAKPETYLDKQFLLETQVAKVCQKKGCFFIAQHDDQQLRIAFQDYAFFIPTDSTNKRVTLAGTLVKKQLSSEQANHFNRDLGNHATDLMAGISYEIVASGVAIKKNENNRSNLDSHDPQAKSTDQQ